MTGKKIKLSDAKCTGFVAMAAVQFSEEGNKKDVGDFQIEAYTGEVVDRWWGKLVVAVDGIQANQKMPILRDHDRGQIVGHSLKSWADGSFFVSGQFSKKTKAAQEVKDLAEEDFPWQASIDVRPLTIMEIEHGVEMEVNGRTVPGPAEIWLESKVFETSFVPLGADENTSVTTFSNFDEAPEEQNINTEKGDNKMKFSIEVLEKESPELLTQIRDTARKEGFEAGLLQGAETEGGRIQAVRSQSLAGHEALIEELMFDGKTSGEQAAVAVLNAERTARNAAAGNFAADGVTPLNHTRTPEVPAPEQKNNDDKTTAELADETWEKDASIREEFANDKDAYLSYIEATGCGLVKKAKEKK